MSTRVSWRDEKELGWEARELARGGWTRDEAEAELRRLFRAPRYRSLIDRALRHFYDADEAAA